MLKKTQRRIVILSISLMFIMLLTVYFVTFSLNKREANDRIFNKISSIESNYSLGKVSPLDDYLVAKIVYTQTPENEKTCLVLQSNNLVLSSSDLIKIIEKTTEEDFLFGSYEKSLFYKFDTEKNLLTVYDAESILSSFKSSQGRIAVFYAVIFAVLIVVAVVVSYKIIQPIEESYFRQQKFISDASHELKTPVAVISANADVLKAQGDSEYLDNIKSQTERMKRLVSDMLTLSSAEERQSEEKERFSLSDEVVKVLLPFDAVAFEKGKFLEFDVPRGIDYFGDRKGLNTILNILVDNAIKYADKNSKISVVLKKEKNKCHVSVFNQGSKIPDEDSEKIFERFFRGDFSRSRETGGSGLGLSIAKSIADNNKWKLTAKSKYNESMLITLVL